MIAMVVCAEIVWLSWKVNLNFVICKTLKKKISQQQQLITIMEDDYNRSKNLLQLYDYYKQKYNHK